ncbi:winged helix-turn-helix transcriptional regulator [Streptomyces roseirectus]|uniref:Winged helix-turn-helix transcriptional regulator n=1 Tax=Streptomyces roseirectus TaxID=2768066 RepID=A0A7H0IQA6_9ACTN|nr:winged helix-turn-helix transcriptional regulator [Streptomyces roseirectus]QNP74972.1 winged helix-turn-helix transcriptional regulator [Streptomyces roseirectus]
MNEDIRRLRGIGMTLELLRNRWTYPVLVALLDGPLGTGRLLALINEGTARNADLVGSRVLRERVLLTTLRQLETEGIFLSGRTEPEPAIWELTVAGRELLHSLNRVAVWVSAHRDQLADALRRHRGHPQQPPGVPVLRPEQEHWRGVGMTLAVLCLRWSFPILCRLGDGLQHPTGIIQAVNAGIARTCDLAERPLSEKMFWDTLHRLVDAGLVTHQPRQGQFASAARCTLTPAGHALLAALAPVGEWAVSHERQLLAAVRRRQGAGG